VSDKSIIENNCIVSSKGQGIEVPGRVTESAEFLSEQHAKNAAQRNAYGVPTIGATFYEPAAVIRGVPYPGFYWSPGADLEYWSRELVGLICDLWKEMDDPAEDSNPRDLATWISGIAAGLSYTEADYTISGYKTRAIADLETLESVLIIRGRSA